MVTVTISAQQAGQNKILLPEYAGLQLLVDRRGVGFLGESEFSSLAEGGVQLTDGVFSKDEMIAVFPKSEIQVLSQGLQGNNVQYPHLLTSMVTGDAARDSNGDWTPGATTLTQLRCRAESSTGNGYILGADGSTLDYSWKVFMPKCDAILVTGASISISDGQSVLCKDTVKRFQKNFFNCVAWL